MEPEVLVTWDADAFDDFEALTNRAERKAAVAAIWKLRDMGNRLGPPHAKSLKGEARLMELRPRQGASPVRLIYRRVGGDYVRCGQGGQGRFRSSCCFCADKVREVRILTDDNEGVIVRYIRNKEHCDDDRLSR